MNYILFDDYRREHLLPLTFFRPVCDIRIGILTIREKWEKYLGVKPSSLTEVYLQSKFPIVKSAENILINGGILPNAELVKQIQMLGPKQALVKGNTIVASYVPESELEDKTGKEEKCLGEIECSIDYTEILNTWDIFEKNEKALNEDFILLTDGRTSQALSSSNQRIGNGSLFIEEGAIVEASVINTLKGPVYIGKNVEVMEGCLIRGPLAICENSVLKMGAKIYGATTLGPDTKVGGEVNNSVIFGFSNKAHDGYLGNSVIAEWCNLGADTNNSNLKNTYDNVKMWDYAEKTFVDTGLQFCGMVMGDHSKCGINTMFNTGTVVGVCTNIFGQGFPRNFIPSFSWGGPSGFTNYKFSKAIEVAANVYKRRNIDLDETEKEIFARVFDIAHTFHGE
ncbi:MAG: GlmU family protein [Lentimicrobiaceae bacterium]|nr:GlmU family protein [Lentimicrobiaceae bacterium]